MMAQRSVGYEYRLFLSNAGAEQWTPATEAECIAVLLKRGLPERVHHKYMRQCVGVTVSEATSTETADTGQTTESEV